MSFDAHKNFAYSTVLTAPSPASSGTSLVVQSGDGAKFPAAPFNATIWPAASQPTTTNAEIVRVTSKSTDTLTITRATESSSARTVVVGDQIAATITAKTITDIETATPSIVSASSSVATNEGTTSTSFTDLSTSGPAVTITVGASGVLLVGWGAEQFNGSTNLSSPALSGANTVAASDSWSLSSGGDIRFGRTHMFTGLTPGSTTVTLKYRTTGGTSQFQQRELWAIAL